MKYRIRFAGIEDMPAVLELVRELARFEREADAVILSVSDLEKAGFGENPLFKCLVAETSEAIVGMALFYPRYSTWKGPTIHLEDLIVTQDMRGMKVGSALYREVISYAYDIGVERVEWAVLDWNSPAIKFYESTGARVLRDWDTVQIDRSAMKNYLNA